MNKQTHIKEDLICGYQGQKRGLDQVGGAGNWMKVVKSYKFQVTR